MSTSLLVKTAVYSEKDTREFRRRWWVANTFAFVVAHALFSPIAHGITGDHGDDLAISQLVAHITAQTLAAVIIVGSQIAVLRQYVQVSSHRIWFAAIFLPIIHNGLISLFGPPWEWIAAFIALSMISWLGLPLTGPRIWLRSATVILSYLIGLAAGVFGVYGVLIDLGIATIQIATFLEHTLFWLAIGSMTGIVGGYLSGWPLSKLLGVRSQSEGT